jgi:hypothetical protein
MNRLIGVFSLVVFINTAVFAQWYVGSQISASLIAPNTYKVRLNLYRNCSAHSAPNYVTFYFHNVSNSSLDFSATLPRISGSLISKPCNPLNYSCSNSNPNFGVEENIYESTVTLPSYSMWIISYSDYARGFATTIPNNNSNGWYVELKINTQFTQNQLPVFSDVPNVIFQKNELVYFNNAAFDADGDSLSYQLVLPKSSSNYGVVYASPYSFTNFCASSIPITINPNTGQIRMRPILNQLTVVDVKIEEWKKTPNGYVLASSLMRDFMFTIFNQINKLPYLSGVDNNWNPSILAIDSFFTTQFIAGQNNSFLIHGVDSNKYDSTVTPESGKFSISMNSHYNFVNFTSHFNFTDSAYAEVHWKPEYSDISRSPFYIAFSITDLACPYNGEQDFIYTINILPPVLSLGNDTTICLSQYLWLSAGDSAFNYSWSTGDSTNAILIKGSDLGIGTHHIWVKREGYGTSSLDAIRIDIDECLSLKENPEQSDFTVFPNPNDGRFYIDLKNESDVHISIIDINGKLVYENKFVGNNLGKVQIQSKHLNSGLYFVKIKTKTSEFLQQFIVE